MESSSNPSPHTGATFAQHLETCLAMNMPVALPGHGEYAVQIVTPEQPSPPDVVHFQGTLVSPEDGQSQHAPLSHVIGSFSTRHSPLRMIVQPRALED